MTPKELAEGLTGIEYPVREVVEDGAPYCRGIVFSLDAL